MVLLGEYSHFILVILNHHGAFTLLSCPIHPIKTVKLLDENSCRRLLSLLLECSRVLSLDGKKT
jgi:hypothetical protein